MPVVLKLNQSAMNRMLKGNGPVQLYVANVGRQVEGQARQRVGVKTGRLKASIRSHLVKVRGEWGAEVTARAINKYGTDYAMFHHDGTRPHVIEGNPLLVFPGRDGKLVFTRRVNHPGTRPNPFLREAANAVGLRLSRRIR